MPRPSGRPAQLDDPVWLAHAYQQDGTPTIAKQLGVSRKMVRDACVRHGITAAEVGRRRGGNPGRRDTDTLPLTGTLRLAAERFHHESRTGGPAPSEQLLAARIHAAHEASQHRRRYPLAYEDALLAVASSALLILQHHRRLRGAE